MRIAVLADVHGNAPALLAVLQEIDREPVDAIVVLGDIVGGPLIRPTLELLAARPEPVTWVAGNAEREAVAVYDGAPVTDDPAGRAAAWSAHSLDCRWRDELGAWPISLALANVRASGFPDVDDMLGESLIKPADPEWVAAFFEHQAGRGPHPDELGRQS